MSDASRLLATIKSAALEAVEASYPCKILFGTVIDTAPLTIQVSQKLILTAEQLLLTDAVRDHWVEMTVNHWTEDETEHTHPIVDTLGGGASFPTTHRHAYRGRKSFLVHRGLREGERVVLQRIQGGQLYLILNRVVSAG